MQTSSDAAAIGQADELVFENKPDVYVWVIFALGVLLAVALFIGSMPPVTLQKAGLALVSVLIGAFCGAVGVFCYRTRNDGRRFYGDRVEVLRRGELLHALPYADVEKVAYGFRGDNDQFLTFSGPNGQPLVSLSLVGDSSKAKPQELNDAKLTALRDVLYHVVAGRLIDAAATPDGATWFGTIRIRRDGVSDGPDRIPWSDVRIDADQSTGRVSVRGNGRVLGQTSMIEDNVVAGLIAIEQVRTGAP